MGTKVKHESHALSRVEEEGCHSESGSVEVMSCAQFDFFILKLISWFLLEVDVQPNLRGGM